MARYASVYPLVTARAVARAFTYEVPDEAEKGSVVEVLFGNARRRGVVTEVDVALPQGVDATAIERVAETLPPALVDLALWIADYYGSTPARALELVAPVRRAPRGERPSPATSAPRIRSTATRCESLSRRGSASPRPSDSRSAGCGRSERRLRFVGATSGSVRPGVDP